MKRTEFIESLKGELIRRGFDEKSAEAEMAPFIGYFEENGIEDVKVSVSDMVKEIMDMRGSAAAAEEPDAGSVRSATDVSAEEEIESALRSAETDTPSGDVSPVKRLMKKKAASSPSDGEASADSEDGVVDSAAEPAETLGDPETGNDSVKTDDEPETALSAVLSTDSATDEPGDGEEPEEDDSDVTVVPDDSEDRDGSDESYDREDGENDFDPDEYTPDLYEDKVHLPGFLKKFLTGLTSGKKKKTDSDEFGEYEEDASDDDGGSDGKAKLLYWVILIVCFPFLLALAAVAVCIYIFFWLVLALLMIFIIAALIAFVTAGAAVAIVGLVYGAIQLIKGAVPIGLFEIGLGIVVASAVAFIGILIYNVAVRLIPFAMKMLAKLLELAFRRTKELFAAVKRTLNGERDSSI